MTYAWRPEAQACKARFNSNNNKNNKRAPNWATDFLEPPRRAETASMALYIKEPHNKRLHEQQPRRKDQLQTQGPLFCVTTRGLVKKNGTERERILMEMELYKTNYSCCCCCSVKKNIFLVRKTVEVLPKNSGLLFILHFS